MHKYILGLEVKKPLAQMCILIVVLLFFIAGIPQAHSLVRTLSDNSQDLNIPQTLCNGVLLGKLKQVQFNVINKLLIIKYLNLNTINAKA